MSHLREVSLVALLGMLGFACAAGCAKSPRAPATSPSPEPSREPGSTLEQEPAGYGQPQPRSGSEEAPETKAAADDELDRDREQPISSLEEAEKLLASGENALIGLGAPEKKAAEKQSRREEGETDCAAATKALGSMRRAADAICALAGSSDARCGKARSRVSDGERRVKAAGCGTT